MTGLLCALPLIGVLIGGCEPGAPRAVGYVEGEYVRLAPVASAELVALEVREGDAVEVGRVVARQDATDAETARGAAAAARDEAAAELADLGQGSRPEEIAVIQAAAAAAEARLAEADRNAERQVTLASGGVVPEATRDDALTERDLAAREFDKLRAELAVTRLPARPHLVAAATSRLERAEAALREAAWRLDRRDIAAPVAGEVTEVYRRVGELAGPAAPVVEILPEGAVKLIFFVPEARRARVVPGTELAFGCDGCPGGLTATVTHVAHAPEFTPPVIYSTDARQKLVWRVEARPAADASPLRPGQIVDVVLP